MENICIDFDGVIHIMKGYDEHYDGWKNGAIEGELAPGAGEAIEKLQEKYNVIVFTTRDNLTTVSLWLNEHNISCKRVTNHKPEAIAYIDDKGIRFESWDQVMDDIEEHISNEDISINSKIREASQEFRKMLDEIEKEHNIKVKYNLDTYGFVNKVNK